MQSRNRDTSIENKHGHQERKAGDGCIGSWRLARALWMLHIKEAADGSDCSSESSAHCSVLT